MDASMRGHIRYLRGKTKWYKNVCKRWPVGVPSLLSWNEFIQYLYSYCFLVLSVDQIKSDEDRHWEMAHNILSLFRGLQLYEGQVSSTPFSERVPIGFSQEWQSMWLERSAPIIIAAPERKRL